MHRDILDLREIISVLGSHKSVGGQRRGDWCVYGGCRGCWGWCWGWSGWVVERETPPALERLNLQTIPLMHNNMYNSS